MTEAAEALARVENGVVMYISNVYVNKTARVALSNSGLLVYLLAVPRARSKPRWTLKSRRGGPAGSAGSSARLCRQPLTNHSGAAGVAP